MKALICLLVVSCSSLFVLQDSEAGSGTDAVAAFQPADQNGMCWNNGRSRMHRHGSGSASWMCRDRPRSQGSETPHLSIEASAGRRRLLILRPWERRARIAVEPATSTAGWLERIPSRTFGSP